jgi:hypothetical protein
MALCPSGKHCYDDYRGAAHQLQRNKKHYPGGYSGHVYRCKLCERLHVGHKPKKVKREAR